MRPQTPVWVERPEVEEPEPDALGRPRTKARLTAGAPAAIPVVAVVAAWSEQRWQRLSLTEGPKGPRIYDWAYSCPTPP